MKTSSPVTAMTTGTRPTTYETDFYTWTQEQAELLRQGRLADLDIKNLIEEIESLGVSQYSALVSAIHRLAQHLLKWQYQLQKRSHSWEVSIDNQRIKIGNLLDDSPGLKSKLDAAILRGYRDGRRSAAKETRLPLEHFPETCPYTWQQLTDEAWLPA
jgi:hypothetical protein